ncbi:hypothetical protein ALO79_100495 [Pseudomonas syringae pv. castaneae]|uniref:Uncharacterized protein n=1 Tax=Pseudomonas syringae pv. castaneae TaxID=264450 RepID=A0A0N8R5H7_PSESX|nr:hypothetical protein ALO79_100495 [Pseudomonas syringae pv. castaneae]
MTGFDVRQHCVHLLGVDQRAHVGRRVQRIAGLPGGQCLKHHRQEAFLDRALDQQPRTGSADFALIEGNCAGGCVGGGLQIRRVGKDNIRAFATGFQPDAFHVRLACVNHQLSGDFARTGKHHGIHVHMQRQRLADGMTVTRQYVEHARRNACLDGQLRNTNGGQRRLLRRLQDHGIAGGQCRTKLPASHHQREVPRHDGGDDADRLSGNQAQLVMRRCGDLVIQLVDGFAAPAQGSGSTGDVDTERVANRFAHVQSLKQGQLFGILLEQPGETDHGFLAFGRSQSRPGTRVEGAARTVDSALRVSGVATGDLGKHPAIDRADAVKRLAGGGCGVFTLNEGTAFDLQILGALLPVSTSQGGHLHVLLLLNVGVSWLIKDTI